MKRAYGGVVINEAARVLLRKPSALHKTRVWTFAKGKPEPGETGEQTALREVLEETGVRAKIIRRLSIPADGVGRDDEYYLMLPLEETGKFDGENLALVWASREEADELISMTEDPLRRERDLELLQVAFQAFGALRAALSFTPGDKPRPA